MLISTTEMLRSFIFCLSLARNYLPVNHPSADFLKLPAFSTSSRSVSSDNGRRPVGDTVGYIHLLC